MKREIIIGGRKVALEWTHEVKKRFNFRLSSIGGHPTQHELTTPSTADAAVCKLLWALLPAQEVARYSSPEDLYVAIDQDKESEAISTAIIGIYADMEPTPQKKTTSKKSRSRGSS